VRRCAAQVVGALRTEGQALGITGAATHLVGRIPYFSIQPNLLVDVLQVRALEAAPCCVVQAAGCALLATPWLPERLR
jgi:hypothetical protein